MTVVRGLQHSGVVIIVVYVDRSSALDVATKRFQARSWGAQVQCRISSTTEIPLRFLYGKTVKQWYFKF